MKSIKKLNLRLQDEIKKLNFKKILRLKNSNQKNENKI
jgi:hypothetical protein